MTTYQPGYAVHSIQARLAGNAPWGWRPGTIRSYGDRLGIVDYLHAPGWLAFWHSRHRDLPAGTPVRVHEQYYLLEVPYLGHASLTRQWLSYRLLDGGLGKVPEPEQPDLWLPECEATITDLGRGVAYPLPRE